MVAVVGCTKKQPAVDAGAAPAAPLSLEEKGHDVYKRNCIACHNVDPAKDGGIGPAVAGSSLELLDARVVKGTYPAGYTPKRPTHTMVALPHLKGDLDALTAYLNKK